MGSAAAGLAGGAHVLSGRAGDLLGAARAQTPDPLHRRRSRQLRLRLERLVADPLSAPPPEFSLLRSAIRAARHAARISLSDPVAIAAHRRPGEVPADDRRVQYRRARVVSSGRIDRFRTGTLPDRQYARVGRGRSGLHALAFHEQQAAGPYESLARRPAAALHALSAQIP